ncbi:MAG: Glycosyl transferase family 2 [Candidatus Amesbacteria bacterium GW2011_GWA2_42_12]|uniref:Glycosyl transferase family 2 n=1 Tax=Candidatus Amesbacteria bacterium GW2011_GWA2_42_12 TaxID=1618356 RepID=A0A0G1A9U3_9BACT|nr:MAG: Glycosyl transferase family 2 [Candidatus Amesbacteria bacterium GW2011_GWA2_42_12]
MSADITGIILYKSGIDHLTKALQSLQWCSERIILVDGDIVDTKVQMVAKMHFSNVFLHSLDTFGEQRNIALRYVKTDWSLFLDADETVSPQLAIEIQDAISKTDHVGFYIHRQDTFMNRVQKHGETSKVALLRIAKTKAGKWERPVHEIWIVSGKTKTLRNPVFHTPHHSIQSFIEKINRYTSLEATLRKKQGKRFSFIELILHPLGKFIYNYVVLFGFLDGFPGLAQAWMMSFHSLVLRVKMYEHV